MVPIPSEKNRNIRVIPFLGHTWILRVLVLEKFIIFSDFSGIFHELNGSCSTSINLVFAASHQLLTHFQREIWGTLGKVPDRSCSQNITPYCPIKPLYNPYIGGICWYISRVLSHGYPAFPFDICPSTRAWKEMVEKALPLLGGSSQDL